MPPTRTHERKPGPLPGVLRGFHRERLTDPDNTDPWWNPNTPAYRALQALRTGATWELAAHFVRLHNETLRQWNSRGATTLEPFDTLDDFLATDPDDETTANVAFHIAALEARASCAVLSLGTISRAANEDRDWRAAAHMIKINPATKHAYAEVTKQELSGPDGGPIQVEDERIRALLARAEAQKQGVDPDAVEDGPGDD